MLICFIQLLNETSMFNTNVSVVEKVLLSKKPHSESKAFISGRNFQEKLKFQVIGCFENSQDYRKRNEGWVTHSKTASLCLLQACTSTHLTCTHPHILRTHTHAHPNTFQHAHSQIKKSRSKSVVNIKLLLKEVRSNQAQNNWI